MSVRIARSIVFTAVAGALSLAGAGGAGSALAQSPAARLASPDGLANRCDAPVSETDVGRVQQHAGFVERGEAPPFDGLRVFLAR